MSRQSVLNSVFWVALLAVGIAAAVVALPRVMNNPSSGSTASALPTRTPVPTRTVTATPTGTPTPVSLVPQGLTPVPSAADAKTFSFNPDPKRSGFFVQDANINWGDPNLHAGYLKGKIFQSVLYFDLSTLPPGTRILFADIQVYGLSRDFVGSTGAWQLKMLGPDVIPNWQNLTPGQFASVPSAATIGTTLGPTQLVANQFNQFTFSSSQLSLLEGVLNGSGQVGFRLDGPKGPEDSIFTWDGGGSDPSLVNQPVLHIVAVPAKFIIVPNVPTPQNIVTAAAQMQTAVAFAAKYGTPTPYPRNYVTATPLVVVTNQPTPANVQTEQALSAFATAIAMTTGTFTPTPGNWITATPSPITYPTDTPTAVALENLTPIATATPPTDLGQLLQTPVPSFLKGNILFYSNRYVGQSLLMMSPAGDLSPNQPFPYLYQLEAAREPLSPDRTRRAIVAADNSGILQIWISDLNNNILGQVTHLAKSGGFRPIAYDPVWSPDGSKIAYVSTETRIANIYVYDLGSGTSRQLTTNTEQNVFNQHPSWSPDSSHIVFKSNRSGHFQIWVMNADGSNQQNLSTSDYDDVDPVWAK